MALKDELSRGLIRLQCLFTIFNLFLLWLHRFQICGFFMVIYFRSRAAVPFIPTNDCLEPVILFVAFDLAAMIVYWDFLNRHSEAFCFAGPHMAFQIAYCDVLGCTIRREPYNICHNLFGFL